MDARNRLIVIPAWNEERALPATLTEVLSVDPQWDVVVIDDGSADGTADVARRLAVPVLQLPINLGVGGAMRAGYRYARRHGYDYVCQLDADGQHDPAEVERIAAPVLAGEADICMGARFAGKGDYAMRGPRRWASVVLARVLSGVTGTRLTDPTSGFKVCGPRAVRAFARDFPQEYLGDTIEALVIASKLQLRVAQVPVAMRPRSAGEPSHSPLRAAKLLVRAGMAMAIALTKKETPIA